VLARIKYQSTNPSRLETALGFGDAVTEACETKKRKAEKEFGGMAEVLK
jgi:hypothetical protein